MIHHKQLDLNQEGSVVDLQALDYGKIFCNRTYLKIINVNTFLKSRQSISFSVRYSNGFNCWLGFTKPKCGMEAGA